MTLREKTTRLRLAIERLVNACEESAVGRRPAETLTGYLDDARDALAKVRSAVRRGSK